MIKEGEWEEVEVNDEDGDVFEVELSKHKSVFNWIMGKNYEKKVIYYQFRKFVAFKYIPRFGKKYQYVVELFDEDGNSVYKYNRKYRYQGDTFTDFSLKSRINNMIRYGHIRR